MHDIPLEFCKRETGVLINIRWCKTATGKKWLATECPNWFQDHNVLITGLKIFSSKYTIVREGIKTKDDYLPARFLKKLLRDHDLKRAIFGLELRIRALAIASQGVFKKGKASLRKVFLFWPDVCMDRCLADGVVCFSFFIDPWYGDGELSSFAFLARFLYVPTIAFTNLSYQV
jgi:hypothetical protein